MPSPSEILASLSVIANRAVAIAVLWHVISAVALLALFGGFRLKKCDAAALLSLPLSSVAITAWLFANPFNGTVFAVAALGLRVLAARGPRDPVRLGGRIFVTFGLALLTYAWVYPHFLVGRSPFAYLYAAPLGVIPCPTLSLVVAAALAGDGLVGGAWRLALACLASFYAVFGMARLGVALDAGLLIGSIALFAQHWAARRG